MRAWQWIGAAVVVVGIGVAVFMLKPVTGPARDLTLAGDATRGAYLIKLGGCVSCHTDAGNGGTALAGGAALQTVFGTFFAPNITPHADAGIGRWSFEQFAKAMSDGEGPQGHLYPVFPFDNYSRLTDQDLADLYAGLMQVSADPKVAPPHQVAFPFNMRIAVAGWKNLFFRPERFEPDPDKSALWNRGAYLATGPAHCVACHSPRNLLGAIESGRELTGNPAGGPGGRAPAITAEALLADGYDPALLIEVLRTGFTPNFDVLGGAMAEVVRDSTSQWTDEDLAALAAYLFDES